MFPGPEKQSMWHQWFNRNLMKLPEYFLCGKKTQIMALISNSSSPHPVCICASILKVRTEWAINILYSSVEMSCLQHCFAVVQMPNIFNIQQLTIKVMHFSGLKWLFPVLVWESGIYMCKQQQQRCCPSTLQRDVCRQADGESTSTYIHVQVYRSDAC